VDVALTLIEPDQSLALLRTVSIGGSTIGWLCLLGDSAEKDVEEAMMNGVLWQWSETPALAMCRAWLERKEAE
jgi:hypothetical protein